MELLLILTYTAFCIAIFKIFRIPVNKWTLSTAALVGIFLIAGLLLVMNYNHPFTKNARIFFATTPILPDVKGRVVEVPVEANLPLKAGDVLFHIDPAPYQYVVDQKEALLVEAQQGVKQQKAALEQAVAAVEKSKVQLRLTEQDYARQEQLYEKRVVSKRCSMSPLEIWKAQDSRSPSAKLPPKVRASPMTRKSTGRKQLSCG